MVYALIWIYGLLEIIGGISCSLLIFQTDGTMISYTSRLLPFSRKESNDG